METLSDFILAHRGELLSALGYFVLVIIWMPSIESGERNMRERLIFAVVAGVCVAIPFLLIFGSLMAALLFMSAFLGHLVERAISDCYDKPKASADDIA